MRFMDWMELPLLAQEFVLRSHREKFAQSRGSAEVGVVATAVVPLVVVVPLTPMTDAMSVGRTDITLTTVHAAAEEVVVAAGDPDPDPATMIAAGEVALVTVDPAAVLATHPAPPADLAPAAGTKGLTFDRNCQRDEGFGHHVGSLIWGSYIAMYRMCLDIIVFMRKGWVLLICTLIYVLLNKMFPRFTSMT